MPADPAEGLASVTRNHIRQLTATCNHSLKMSAIVFWPPKYLHDNSAHTCTHMCARTHAHTHTLMAYAHAYNAYKKEFLKNHADLIYPFN